MTVMRTVFRPSWKNNLASLALSGLHQRHRDVASCRGGSAIGPATGLTWVPNIFIRCSRENIEPGRLGIQQTMIPIAARSQEELP
jgi:hypothetical protein